MDPLVLVVDDDRDIRLTLVSILREHGFRTTEARNGLEALEEIAVHEPDLVILDLIMPVINGWDVLRTLRASRPKLPIVILSAVKADDPADYVQKPISIERMDLLLATIRTRVSERSAAHA